MGVDDPVLDTSTTADDGSLPVIDGGDVGDGFVDPDSGCVGEGCACTDDNGCADSAPYTKCVAGACSECTTEPDSCPIGRYCLKGAGDGASADGGGNKYNACAPGCSSDAHCKALTPTAPYCDLTRHRCVACKSDLDCTAFNQGCSPSGVCADKCGTDGGSCPGSLVCCNQFCVDTTKDVLNCGGCNKSCGNQDVCCSSSCKNTLTDVSNCGACGTVCNNTNNTPGCTAGACKFNCTVGFNHCPPDSPDNNGCATATSSKTLCGSCTTDCTTTVQNAGGVDCKLSSNAYKCTYSTCNANFGDCNNSAADGCECACGKKNQPCCANNSCTESGTVCARIIFSSKTICAACGNNNEPCCSGNRCNSGNICTTFGCRACANGGSRCDRDSDCCSNDCKNDGKCR